MFRAGRCPFALPCLARSTSVLAPRGRLRLPSRLLPSRLHCCIPSPHATSCCGQVGGVAHRRRAFTAMGTTMAAVGPRKHGAASLGGHQRQLALDASGVGRSRAGVGCCAQTGETVHGRALDLGRRRDRAGAGTTAPNRWGGASDKAGVRVGLAFLAFLASCLSAANGPLCSRSLRFKSPCGLRLPLLKRCCPSSSRAWCWHCAYARAMQVVF